MTSNKYLKPMCRPSQRVVSVSRPHQKTNVELPAVASALKFRVILTIVDEIQSLGA